MMFGNIPVPYTVAWTGEERFFVGVCPYSQRPAVCQHEAPGTGKPLFGKPHAIRQRRAIALTLCDLCGRSLKVSTKVSLSHARPQPHGAEGWAILQVEPLLHVACAARCLEHCPSLRRDIAAGTLMVRHVTRSRPQFAIMAPEYVRTVAGEARKAVGHAKVELIQWHDRDEAWLRRKAGSGK